MVQYSNFQFIQLSWSPQKGGSCSCTRKLSGAGSVFHEHASICQEPCCGHIMGGAACGGTAWRPCHHAKTETSNKMVVGCDTRFLRLLFGASFSEFTLNPTAGNEPHRNDPPVQRLASHPDRGSVARRHRDVPLANGKHPESCRVVSQYKEQFRWVHPVVGVAGLRSKKCRRRVDDFFLVASWFCSYNNEFLFDL